VIARAAAVILLLSLAPACDSDNTPECAPTVKQACYCDTGAPGEQVCDDDGLHFGGCVCLPDGGASPDAGSPDAAAPPDAAASR
jgi:hypothetical protein